VVPCGQLEGWPDMMKLIVTFCNVANACKNSNCFPNKIQRVLHLHQFVTWMSIVYIYVAVSV